MMTNLLTYSKNHPWLLKAVALTICFSALLALISSNVATNLSGFEPNTNKYIFQNISTGLVVASFVLGFALQALQENAYALFGKPKTLDERQKNVRNKVYERAYAGIIITALLSMIFIARDTSHAVSVASWLLISAIINLPSILAAFEKNS